MLIVGSWKGILGNLHTCPVSSSICFGPVLEPAYRALLDPSGMLLYVCDRKKKGGGGCVQKKRGCDEETKSNLIKQLPFTGNTFHIGLLQRKPRKP